MSESRRNILCAAAAACLALCGCASSKKEPGDGRAPSLVYSPAERLPPAGDMRTTSGDLSQVTVAQDTVLPPAGRRCRVHLRRDSLGVANPAPYPIVGNNIAAERALRAGTLERVGRDWLVLRGERSTFWLPREAVLAVEFVE